MELTVAATREELVRKYRELAEKHGRLLKRMEEQAQDRLLATRLSRAILRSRVAALALLEGGSVVAANPAWRLLDTPSEPREWSGTGMSPHTFTSLAAAATDPATASAPNGNAFVRVADGLRVRLRVELLDSDGASPASILAIAIEDREMGARLHRIRNHLAAARFQTELLLEETDAGPGAARRATTVAELVRLAAEALEPSPQPDR